MLAGRLRAAASTYSMTEPDPAEARSATLELQHEVLVVHFLRVDGVEVGPIRVASPAEAAELVSSMNPAEIYLRVSSGTARAAFALVAGSPMASSSLTHGRRRRGGRSTSQSEEG